MTAGHLRARPAAPAHGRRSVGVPALEIAVAGRPDPEVGDRRELLPVEPGRLSVSSQYGRKPNTSRRRPPGSTAAARSARWRRRAGPRQGTSTGRPRRLDASRGRGLRVVAGDGQPAADRATGQAPGRAGCGAARRPPSSGPTPRGLNGTVTRSPAANGGPVARVGDGLLVLDGRLDAALRIPDHGRRCGVDRRFRCPGPR